MYDNRDYDKIIFFHEAQAPKKPLEKNPTLIPKYRTHIWLIWIPMLKHQIKFRQMNVLSITCTW